MGIEFNPEHDHKGINDYDEDKKAVHNIPENSPDVLYRTERPEPKTNLRLRRRDKAEAFYSVFYVIDTRQLVTFGKKVCEYSAFVGKGNPVIF